LIEPAAPSEPVPAPAAAPDPHADRLVGLPMPRSVALIHDASLRPTARTPGARRFPFPIPNGWFVVARADELGPREKRNRRYFGRDLVVFRTESGEPRTIDAYCPHLGAHLGVGGSVQGEEIACPFHGWRFDGASGRCTQIPYAKTQTIPKRAQIRAFPTLERNRLIWAWHHLEDGPPFYEVPVVPEFDDARWSAPLFHEFPVRTACQEMAENNHDAAHFQFVHGTPGIPEDEIVIDGTFKRATAQGGNFVRESHGLGLGVLRVKNVVTFISSTTPIDEETVHVRWTFVAPRANGDKALHDIAHSFLSGVSQDVPIWENKIYRERPVLTRGEKTVADHRRWSQQFYSYPAPPREEPLEEDAP
jgi:nitrite reductase/ring-hydroxylating ferredoxin subunit